LLLKADFLWYTNAIRVANLLVLYNTKSLRSGEHTYYLREALSLPHLRIHNQLLAIFAQPTLKTSPSSLLKLFTSFLIPNVLRPPINSVLQTSRLSGSVEFVVLEPGGKVRAGIVDFSMQPLNHYDYMNTSLTYSLYDADSLKSTEPAIPFFALYHLASSHWMVAVPSLKPSIL
jgi:hypothetical protein